MKQFLSAIVLCLASASAFAAPIFVGSWQVDQGPSWTTQPLAYTGQEAAALLFAGDTGDANPANYLVSTVDDIVANINNSAWYSIVGVSGGTVFAHDYVAPGSSQDPGYYYSGAPFSFSALDAASAYVDDNALGSQYTNFAFYIGGVPGSVPEPSTVMLLMMGLAGLGLRRRKKV